MVFANEFNVPAFDGDISGGYEDHVAELEHFAKHGVVQCSCGNSCPGVYRGDNDEFWIGNPGHNKEHQIEEHMHMPGEQVTSVTTDLWAWSMTDLRNALKTEGKKLQSDRYGYYSYVRVTPGTYRVTQKFYANNGYGPSDQADIFATIKRVGRRSLRTQYDDVALDTLNIKKLKKDVLNV